MNFSFVVHVVYGHAGITGSLAVPIPIRIPFVEEVSHHMANWFDLHVSGLSS